MSAVLDLAGHDVPLARARLELLFDAGSFRPTRSAVGDGVIAGSGRVSGRPLHAWAQDGTFKGGSLGAAGGETIARTIRRAAATGAPVVGFPHSGGARLHEIFFELPELIQRGSTKLNEHSLMLRMPVGFDETKLAGRGVSEVLSWNYHQFLELTRT